MLSSFLLALVASTGIKQASALPVLAQNVTIPSNVTEYVIDLAQNGTILSNFTLQSTSLNGTFTNGTMCVPTLLSNIHPQASRNWTLANITTVSPNATYHVNKTEFLFPKNFTFTVNVTCNTFNHTIANVTVAKGQNFTLYKLNSTLAALKSQSTLLFDTFDDVDTLVDSQTSDYQFSVTTPNNNVAAQATPPLLIATSSPFVLAATVPSVSPAALTTTTSTTKPLEPLPLNTAVQTSQSSSSSTSSTSSTPAAQTTTSQAASVQTVSIEDSQISKYTGETFSGPATYYATGLGACGWVNSDTDFIAAAAKGLFDSFPNGGNTNNSPICGRKAIVTGPAGAQITVAITDRCDGCDDMHALDFSPSAFEALVAGAYVNSNSGLGIGRVSSVNWQWA